MSLVAKGLRNEDIAREMRTTKYMIGNELVRIYDKSGFSNRVELALWYVRYREQEIDYEI